MSRRPAENMSFSMVIIYESWRHLEDEGHEIRSRVGQPWKLGICHKALALAPLSVSLYLKASVSCKQSGGKCWPLWKKIIIIIIKK